MKDGSFNGRVIKQFPPLYKVKHYTPIQRQHTNFAKQPVSTLNPSSSRKNSPKETKKLPGKDTARAFWSSLISSQTANFEDDNSNYPSVSQSSDKESASSEAETILPVLIVHPLIRTESNSQDMHFSIEHEEEPSQPSSFNWSRTILLSRVFAKSYIYSHSHFSKPKSSASSLKGKLVVSNRHRCCSSTMNISLAKLPLYHKATISLKPVSISIPSTYNPGIPTQFRRTVLKKLLL